MVLRLNPFRPSRWGGRDQLDRGHFDPCHSTWCTNYWVNSAAVLSSVKLSLVEARPVSLLMKLSPPAVVTVRFI